MKKLLCSILLACSLLCLLSGCSNPNSRELDLSQGYGRRFKLLHLNASSSEKRERIEGFCKVVRDAAPLEKDLSLFAYYPDYRLQVRFASEAEGEDIDVVVDVNGEFIDFYDPNEGDSPTIYRSQMSAEDFKSLVHWVGPIESE